METTISNKNKKALFIYYALLLIIMSSWVDIFSSPPMILRMGLFVGIFLPLLFNVWLSPIVLSLFLIVSDCSFAEAVLPKGTYLYILALLSLLFLRKYKNTIPSLNIAVVLLIYTFVINIGCNSSLSSAPLYKSLFFLFVFSLLTIKSNKDYIHFFSYTFIGSSLILSLLLLIFGGRFSHEVGDFESFMWMDANYWSHVIGMGVLAAIFELFNNDETKPIIKLIFIAIIALGIGVVFFVSSRGALMSLFAAIMVYLLASNLKKKYRFLSIVGLAIIVYLIYNFNFMDQMLFRFFEEGTMNTGSGRTDIWLYKMSLFFQTEWYSVLFGLGRGAGSELGADGSIAGYLGYMSTHNDFVSFLIYYGIIGFLMFINLITIPFRHKNNRKIVLCGFVFIIFSLFTIEPFATGNFAWYAFLFYLYVWSQSPLIISSRIIKNS